MKEIKYEFKKFGLQKDVRYSVKRKNDIKKKIKIRARDSFKGRMHDNVDKLQHE